MPKNAQYLLLLIVLIAFSGCETVNGASSGFCQDVRNTTNPDANGWNALKKMDAWMQENMW